MEYIAQFNVPLRWKLPLFIIVKVEKLFQMEGQLPEAARQELLTFGDRFVADPNIEQLPDSQSVIVKFTLSKYFHGAAPTLIFSFCLWSIGKQLQVG